MSKQKHKIYVRILQNGYPISETQKRFVKNQRIFLSSKLKGELTIPFYNLPKENLLLKVTPHNKAELNFIFPFEGMVVSEGKVIKLDGKTNGNSFELTPGDYATLSYRDLRFLVKIEREKRRARFAKNKQFNTKFFSFIGHESIEVKSGFASLFCAAFIFSCIIFGFKSRPHDAPSSISDLEDVFVLPFIHKDSFDTAPEALKFNLNRSNYISDTIKYYRNFVHIFSGLPMVDQRLLFPSSQKYFMDRTTKKKQKVNSLVAKHKKRVTREASTPSAQVVSIPSVYKESFQDNLFQITQKVASMQKGFKSSLELRHKTTERYMDDPEYEWGDYTTFDHKGNKKAIEALSQIKVFGQLTNEELMYDTAKKLGEKASRLMSYYDHHRSHNEELDRDSVENVYIDGRVPHLSFLNTWLPENDTSLNTIPSSSYAIHKKFILPTGTVPAKLVNSKINAQKYKLRLCYEKGLRKIAGLKGDMTWSWWILPSGKISRLKLQKSSISEKTFLSCTRKLLLSLKFPKPKKGSVAVEQSFQFYPENG